MVKREKRAPTKKIVFPTSERSANAPASTGERKSLARTTSSDRNALSARVIKSAIVKNRLGKWYVCDGSMVVEVACLRIVRRKINAGTATESGIEA